MAYPVSWLVSFIAYIAYLKLKRGIFPKENERRPMESWLLKRRHEA